MKPKFAAVIAAGGRGLRFSTDGTSTVPKQFTDLLGTPIYVWALTTFLRSPQIDRVVIVAPSDAVPMIQDQLPAHLSKRGPELLSRQIDVVAGGDTRQKSVYLGLEFLDQSDDVIDYVLIHDAARPFLTAEIIDRVIDGVIKYGACTTAIPLSDTIKRSDGELVQETISRDSLVLVQTPQAARLDWLLAAHKSAEQNAHATTDDAAVLELAGHNVGIVRGAPYNIKLTQSEDMILAKALASIVLADRI